MRRGFGEIALAVDGVDEALSPPRLVFNVSSDGRDDGVGECAREEAMDGRGEDSVDIMAIEGTKRRRARKEGQINGFKQWSVLLLFWSSFRFHFFPNLDLATNFYTLVVP